MFKNTAALKTAFNKLKSRMRNYLIYACEDYKNEEKWRYNNDEGEYHYNDHEAYFNNMRYLGPAELDEDLLLLGLSAIQDNFQYMAAMKFCKVLQEGIGEVIKRIYWILTNQINDYIFSLKEVDRYAKLIEDTHYNWGVYEEQQVTITKDSDEIYYKHQESYNKTITIFQDDLDTWIKQNKVDKQKLLDAFDAVVYEEVLQY